MHPVHFAVARMANVGMAMDAVLHVTLRGRGQQRMHKITMAVHAGALSDSAVAWFDFDRIGIATQGECQGVEESIVTFDDPLADFVVRQVAIIANGNMVVRTLLPRIKVRLHHVTIDARLGLVAQVAGTFAVTESERADTGEQSQYQTKGKRCF